MKGVTRRIVTGHDAAGQSVVISDSTVPNVRTLPGARFDEVWATTASPEPLGLSPDNEPTCAHMTIGPAAPGGSVVRIIEFAPPAEGGVRSPMHRTRTIDYGIVLAGEMVLILTDSEVQLRAGDVVVQRGTDHAWENRSGRPATMAFILLGADFGPELAALLDGTDFTA
jgi:quercetin dioxygenase-like cupin family protein